MTDPTPARPSAAFRAFTYVNFAVAAVMMAGGIYFLEASFAAKGFYAMAVMMLVSSTISITKTLRDDEEAQRLRSQLEEARAARLRTEAGPKA